MISLAETVFERTMTASRVMTSAAFIVRSSIVKAPRAPNR
jgi:hypothetical protein